MIEINIQTGRYTQIEGREYQGQPHRSRCQGLHAGVAEMVLFIRGLAANFKAKQDDGVGEEI